MNQRNQVHGVDVGVFKDIYLKHYRASWCELNGNRQQRYFKWADYSGIDEAYIAAKACRTENESRVRAEIVALQSESPGGIVHIEKKQTRTKRSISNTGVKHLYFKKDPTHSERLIAQITINNTPYRASWATASFPTRDDALVAGAAWLSDIKAKNPKAPRPKKQKLNVE